MQPTSPRVGVLAMAVHFPSRYVAQTDLEIADGGVAFAGKYTIGLGQKAMAFCDDREDAASLAMGALSRLLDISNVDARLIKRLDVGTESAHDRAKSIKTALIPVLTRAAFDSAENERQKVGSFEEKATKNGSLTRESVDKIEVKLNETAHNGDKNNGVLLPVSTAPEGSSVQAAAEWEAAMIDVDGADNVQACYGGTAAFFNCVAWCESSTMNPDRENLAVMVASDIAAYTAGPARPTAGAGAVAILIGWGGSLCLEPGLFGTISANAYDFYKPDPRSEYPFVDGHLSIRCYLRALDECYLQFKRRWVKANSGRVPNLDQMVDLCCFHSPFSRLVEKSLGRLFLIDFLDGSASFDNSLPSGIAQRLRDELEHAGGELCLVLESCVGDRDIERAFLQVSNSAFKRMTDSSLLLARELGNTYCASVWGGVLSLFASPDSDASSMSSTTHKLAGKRILVFSYGSGISAKMFCLHVSHTVADAHQLCIQQGDLCKRLQNRTRSSVKDFEAAMKLREEAWGLAAVPRGSIEHIQEGAYFVCDIDGEYRRTYGRR